MVDAIPPRAKWFSKQLAFYDQPDSEHTIYYRSPIDGIRTLLGNPAHASHIVYKPKKIFRNSSKTTRIYNEMWTGRWWHAIQVSLLQLLDTRLRF
jgi:hypothetical protein